MVRTSGLDPRTVQRLREYTTLFRGDFARAEQVRWAAIYLQGLLHPGERKSIESLARRVRLPTSLGVADPAQALQNFVNQSSWDEQKLWRHYRMLLAPRVADPNGSWVLTNDIFPKRGRHSVGVHRQYNSGSGAKTNCQSAVTLHYVSPKGYLPLALRLYLPKSWSRDPGRLAEAGVPPQYRDHETKAQIALELLDKVRAEAPDGQTVVAEAAHGLAAGLDDALAARGLNYLAEVDADLLVFPELPPGKRESGHPVGTRPARLAQPEKAPQPVPLQRLASLLHDDVSTWQPGFNGPASNRFAWVRVRPGSGPLESLRHLTEGLGLLLEEQPNRTIKYILSNLPARTTCLQAAQLWNTRSTATAGFQRIRQELGLDHFEGRSWRGFHHHACLVMLAYGFWLWEQDPDSDPLTPVPAVKK